MKRKHDLNAPQAVQALSPGLAHVPRCVAAADLDRLCKSRLAAQHAGLEDGPGAGSQGRGRRLTQGSRPLACQPAGGSRQA